MRYCPDVRVPRTRRNNPERFFAGTRDLELSEIVDISIPDKPLPLLSPSTRSIINRSEENSRSDNNTLSDKSGEGDNDELIQALAKPYKDHSSDQADAEEDELLSIPEEIMSMRMGLVWLGIVTVAISILSDIIVETIDGFAIKSKMSEVFTSVIIIPYFSNIAEQVSAVIFAYRNKMDLCIGVTVGSAIQIGQFVMPGCVLVAWAMDRSMTLYFRGYETICLLLGVLCVAAVLQGGTTNWLVGVFLVGVYIQIAAGFAFHEIEDLSKDAES